MTEPEVGAGDTEALVVEQHGPIRVLRLNRPEQRNTMTGAMLTELSRRVVEADTDPDTRVLVVTATGDRTFCAGLDLREFSETGTASVDTTGFLKMLHGELSVPVIFASEDAEEGAAAYLDKRDPAWKGR